MLVSLKFLSTMRLYTHYLGKEGRREREPLLYLLPLACLQHNIIFIPDKYIWGEILWLLSWALIQVHSLISEPVYISQLIPRTLYLLGKVEVTKETKFLHVVQKQKGREWERKKKKKTHDITPAFNELRLLEVRFREKGSFLTPECFCMPREFI